VDSLLADLARACIGSTFNQYREHGSDDVVGAAAIRLANLRRYLAERSDADVVAVGEAAGYQGARWSGIAFTSERDLLAWGTAYRPTCSARRWSEPSGTIVHRVLDKLGAERRVVLWNTVPTHPHLSGNLLSNRRPHSDEIAAGAQLAERLIEILRPRLLVAVGRVAEGVFPRACYVRHPANAGGAQFAAGMRSLLVR
jgi:uracil-DNA glycosylase